MRRSVSSLNRHWEKGPLTWHNPYLQVDMDGTKTRPRIACSGKDRLIWFSFSHFSHFSQHIDHIRLHVEYKIVRRTLYELPQTPYLSAL